MPIYLDIRGAITFHLMMVVVRNVKDIGIKVLLSECSRICDYNDLLSNHRQSFITATQYKSNTCT